MTFFLYYCNAFQLPSSQVQIMFLLVVLLVVPLVGQVWPTSMLFPLAYRHNSGNLRIGQFLVKHSAQAKLENFITDGDMFYGERLPAADGGVKLSIGVLLH